MTAVDAAVAVTRRLGLPAAGDPVVLRKSSSVIVVLAPSGPVAPPRSAATRSTWTG